MNKYTTHDGITVTLKPFRSHHFTACVTVSHPAIPIRPWRLYNGGQEIADAVTARLLAEMRQMLAEEVTP